MRRQLNGLRVAASCVAGLLLLSTGGCGLYENRSNLKKGNSAYLAGKYDEAIDFYSRIPTSSLDGVRGALNTGYAYWKQYRFGSKNPRDREIAARAVEAFESYIEHRPAKKKVSNDFPSSEAIEERIITLLIDSDRFEDAIDRMEAKLKEKGEDPAILRGIATAYDKWNKPTIAIQYFNRWAKNFPKVESPHVAIAAYCWNMSFRRHMMMEPVERNRWVDTGLAAVEKALAINPEHFESVTYKNLLLRERAKLRCDPDLVARLMAEADVYLAKAREIRDRKKEEEARARGEEPKPKADDQKEAGTGDADQDGQSADQPDSGQGDAS